MTNLNSWDVYRSRDRQGCHRRLLRVPGRKAVTLKGVYGSPEFMASYQAATSGVEAGQARATGGKHGTIAALAKAYLASAHFAGLAPETGRKKRHAIELFAE